MKIQLIDKNIEMCKQWQTHFKGTCDVVIHNGDFFSLKTDCVVSPANSFGFMDGALDYVISERLGWHLQEKLQKRIYMEYNGELLVGQALLITTDNTDVPYCLSAPTMRVPLILQDSVNVYLAARAIFLLLRKEKDKINTITISGLGTGVGKVPYDICAKQMKKAYDDFWLGEYEYPKTWKDAQIEHHQLLK